MSLKKVLCIIFVSNVTFFWVNEVSPLVKPPNFPIIHGNEPSKPLLRSPSPVSTIEVASVINLSEALGRVAAGLFMTEG